MKMKHYSIQNLDFILNPRCDCLTQEDAIALVGYCYGRFLLAMDMSNIWLVQETGNQISPWEKCFLMEDMLLVLFCCGANKDDIILAARDYIQSVLDIPIEGLKKRDVIVHSLRLQDISRLIMALDCLPDLIPPLITVIEKILITWKITERIYDEDRLGLHLCHCAFSKSPINMELCKIDFATASFAKLIITHDGVGLAKFMDNELRTILMRLEVFKKERRSFFLDRTKCFRIFGEGFLFTGIREIGKALGCEVPPPAADTLMFYLH